MSVPWNLGPVVWNSFQPLAHRLPSNIFAGGALLRSVHLRTSKLARWLLAARAVHTTPLLSISTPRGSRPGEGTLKIWVVQVSGGLLPIFTRIR